MVAVELDFEKYIAQQKTAEEQRPGAAYAYPGDQKVLRTLAKVTPVRLAAEATVRLWKSVAKNEILGTSVKVTERQFPELHQLAIDCAQRLDIPTPTIYVAPNVGELNAHTFGTEEDSFIVLNGVLIDHLSIDELRFVVGHECGHVHNNHVVYTTTLYYLLYSANVFVRWIVHPAVLALQSWARRAEITCDRAGMLCTSDATVAERALAKLALGSKKLADRVDIDEYVKQMHEGQTGVGRVAEFFRSHPYLPKRLAALKLFAQTHFYLRATDQLGEDETLGHSLNWCDAEVAKIVRVFGSTTSDEAKER